MSSIHRPGKPRGCNAVYGMGERAWHGHCALHRLSCHLVCGTCVHFVLLLSMVGTDHPISCKWVGPVCACVCVCVCVCVAFRSAWYFVTNFSSCPLLCHAITGAASQGQRVTPDMTCMSAGSACDKASQQVDHSAQAGCYSSKPAVPPCKSTGAQSRAP
jgi:hypothetical protein